MSDNTRINPGVGGDNIATEDLGSYKIPVVKIRTGALDTDGGDVTTTNPLPTQLSQGNAAVSSTNPIPTQLSLSNVPVGPSNPVPSTLIQGGSSLTASNPVPAQLSQGNSAASATNPVPTQLSQGNAAASAANPIPAQLSVGNAVVTNANPLPTTANVSLSGSPITASNPLAVQLSQGDAVLTAANPVPAQLSQGGAALAATNPVPTQLSQGNAAITAANPIPAQLSQGGAVLAATNPVPTQLSVGNVAAGATNPVPTQLSVGNVAAGATNPVPTQLSVANAAATAANPVPVQLSQAGAVLTNANPIPTKIGDGTNVVGTTQGRNSDNQTPSPTAFQLDVSGPTAILNPCSNSNGVNAGGYDRQRATAFDNTPAAGITAGTSQFAIPFTTTLANGAITGGNTPQTVTVTSAANLKVGDYVSVDGANPEFIFVQTVVGSTISAVFKNSHTGSENLSWFHYNVARDAGAGNNIALTGLSASAVYFYNSITGLGELERSAAGELDGATGNGTAIAAEYEWNGNPLANGGVLSGNQFDRRRNINAKGKGGGLIMNNPLAAGSTSLTLSSSPNTLQPGQRIVLDRAGVSPETNYVGTSYTPGSTAVPLQIATQFSHAMTSTVEWDQHATLGPGVNGFLPGGLSVEEEAIYDPVSLLYYVELAATQDALPATNTVAENMVLWNGTAMDRARSASANNMDGYSGVGALITTTPGNWSVFNAPGSSATQASVTKPAGGITARHVCNSISASYTAGSTNGTTLLIQLLDGIEVVWGQYIDVLQNDCRTINISGLNIVGSPGQSMTLQFSAAGPTNTFQSVAMTGYDVF